MEALIEAFPTQSAGIIPLIDVSAPDFGHFYELHADKVAHALTVTLGDAELAADATAEAMTKAWQQWKKISAYDNPAGWTYRVGMNWALSWRRRRKRERDRPIRFSADQIELELRDDSLDSAIDELSLDHRAVVVCRLYLDWSVTETADALGIAEGTVKSRLARALDELRKSVEEDA